MGSPAPLQQSNGLYGLSLIGDKMYPALQKELETFERRTPKSAEAHKKNLKRIPLGVASNYRAYDPYPIFVKDAGGSKFRDLDGNEYIDHNLCFGALMAGHCHPAVMKAVGARLTTGTMFGMPHDMEWELAEEICKRFPVEMVRFGNSGTEATMHACRLARAATGRDKILKFEGGYHGLHDTALVSVKPHAPDYGDVNNPTSVPGGLGVPKASLANVPIATFNDLASVERRFAEDPGQIAAIILEPIMMNVGLCIPQPGFLKGLRDIATKNGALLIFDEVKTGAKLGWGGASEYFNLGVGAADFQFDVNAPFVAGGEDDISHHKLLETSGLRAQFISAFLHRIDGVVTGLVGLRRGFDPGIAIDRGDFDPCDYRSGRIGNRAGDTGKRGLGVGRLVYTYESGPENDPGKPDSRRKKITLCHGPSPLSEDSLLPFL